jgi:hypothetical protein
MRNFELRKPFISCESFELSALKAWKALTIAVSALKRQRTTLLNLTTMLSSKFLYVPDTVGMNIILQGNWISE